MTAVNNILGSDYDDILIGNLENNILDGGAGNDIIKGVGGNNTIKRNDRLWRSWRNTFAEDWSIYDYENKNGETSMKEAIS